MSCCYSITHPHEFYTFAKMGHEATNIARLCFGSAGLRAKGDARLPTSDESSSTNDQLVATSMIAQHHLVQLVLKMPSLTIRVGTFCCPARLATTTSDLVASSDPGCFSSTVPNTVSSQGLSRAGTKMVYTLEWWEPILLSRLPPSKRAIPRPAITCRPRSSWRPSCPQRQPFV